MTVLLLISLDRANDYSKEQLESSLEWGAHAVGSPGIWACKVGKLVFSFNILAYYSYSVNRFISYQVNSLAIHF